ncbi:MAG: hypothetical protein R3F59_36855 [Myxococcota bacterium]
MPPRPDPYLPDAPFGPHAAALVTPARTVPISPALAHYLWWRLAWLEVSAAAPAPDLSRWTERLLRRHGLREPPAADHPYWDEWRERTRAERAQPPPGRGTVATFKLAAPGRWILVPDERTALADALRSRIERHEVPPALADAVQDIVLSLVGPEEVVEIDVVA